PMKERYRPYSNPAGLARLNRELAGKNQFAVSAPANRQHDPKLPLILNGRVLWLTLALAYFSVDGGFL
ncbi:MAG TPA: hypothetical protein VFC29_16705, partial [Candidatus Limnocylindrales bacterium]|nr:hypothetical protein [Candidatus Limnocylindrales bacterium]